MTQAMSQITVVVPVYNRADIVTRTLDSIASQWLRPLHLVVVDNGSTDETLGVVTNWRETHISSDFFVTILQESKPGACAARNSGLRIVSTPYVMFFDSDDVMESNHVGEVVAAIESNKDVDIVQWGTTRHGLDGKVYRKQCRRGDHLFNHLFHATLATQCWCARTELVRRVGAWDETLMGWNDYELGVRLLLAAKKVVKMPNSWNVHVYLQENSITGTNYVSGKEKWEESLKKCESVLRQSGRADAIKYIETRRCILAGLYSREQREDESERLLGEVLSREPKRLRRMFYRFVRGYVAHGGRGVSILAKLL